MVIWVRMFATFSCVVKSGAIAAKNTTIARSARPIPASRSARLARPPRGEALGEGALADIGSRLILSA